MTERTVGTVSRGIRTPIITDGDDLVKIVVDSVLKAASTEGFEIQDRDIISITESIVARAQGNYVHIDEVTEDICSKFASETIGVVFPILSRNRFSMILRSIVRSGKKIVLVLNYPADEVGNRLIDPEIFIGDKVNPYVDALSEEQFRELFGNYLHPFTGIDYVEYYKSILMEGNPESQIVFSNNPVTVLDYTKNVLVAEVHDRIRTKDTLIKNGVETVFTLDDFLRSPIKGKGYNPEYGLLGSNSATDVKMKLFPRDCKKVVDQIQALMKEKTGKDVEVMVYGDGAFKDPVGGIWELADPVVSPAFTKGLLGTPSEVKLKYLADQQFGDLRGDELTKAVTAFLANKEDIENKAKASQGTTPRRLTDLLGSLSDLTSGSGDKGTPVVFIQGYFDSYAK
ncbi:MAG TPA: F420-0--gamma-glutamyl ligase [Natronincola sp.]|nr:F420-0--gamma-glutamyl ligase [Natronincola sp.]